MTLHDAYVKVRVIEDFKLGAEISTETQSRPIIGIDLYKNDLTRLNSEPY